MEKVGTVDGADEQTDDEHIDVIDDERDGAASEESVQGLGAEAEDVQNDAPA